MVLNAASDTEVETCVRCGLKSDGCACIGAGAESGPFASLPTMDATYDPADNKIRLRSVSRLPKELYDRVKTAGYHWAPQQKLFVAPMWTPEREDLAIELCGELGDEDTSLVERAEERAERFEEYGEKRAEDAEHAHAAVERLTGQPILGSVGNQYAGTSNARAVLVEGGSVEPVRMLDVDSGDRRTRVREDALPARGMGGASSRVETDARRPGTDGSPAPLRQSTMLQPGSPVSWNAESEPGGHGPQRTTSEESDRIPSDWRSTSFETNAGSVSQGREERVSDTNRREGYGHSAETEGRGDISIVGESVQRGEEHNQVHRLRKDLATPVVVAHHSARHAQRTAEKIKAGMTRAVKMWETSKYWEARAKGALRHAKYKEDPGVRHRRIKGLEADLRKHEKERDASAGGVQVWSKPDLTRERALFLANYDRLAPFGTWSALDKNEITVEEAVRRVVSAHERMVTHHNRWISHLTNRLTYERAMLAESGDITVKAQGFDVQPGGQVLERHGWAVVLRVNKTAGAVNSYTIASRWGKMKIGIEEVTDYRPPSAEDAAKVQAATKLPPLVNYPGEGFRSMTKADWDSRARCSDFYRTVRVKETEKHGAHRQRMVPEGGGSYKDVPAYITDVPRKDPPAPSGPKPELPQALPREPRVLSTSTASRDKFAAMKDQLKAGVQVVSADQLFPTPPELCARMVRLAGVGEGDRVLEPSAGTGNIVQAIRARGGQPWCIEIDPRLAARLPEVVCIDFLEVVPSLVDAVVMNPPFKDGADIKHILHARSFLKPGGRLVAICAGGPRQLEKLRPLCETWESLPEGTFAGTGVHAVLLTMRGPS